MEPNLQIELIQEAAVVGTVRVKVPQLLKERKMSASDLMYGARLAPGTAYKLADEKEVAEMTAISFDVLSRVCRFLNVDIRDILQLEEEPDKAGEGT